MYGCAEDIAPLVTRDLPIKFGINYQVITVAKFIETQCNAFIFINQGTTLATLDSAFTLAPGESLALNANRKEICIHGFTVSFSGGGTNNLVMIRKFYSEIDVY